MLFAGLAQSLELDAGLLHDLFTAFHCRSDGPRETFFTDYEWEGISVSALSDGATALLEEVYTRGFAYKNAPVRDILEICNTVSRTA